LPFRRLGQVSFSLRFLPPFGFLFAGIIIIIVFVIIIIKMQNPPVPVL